MRDGDIDEPFAVLLFWIMVTITVAVATAMALSGCQSAPELTPFERQAVHAARLGWVASGHTEGTGKCDFGATQIVRPSMSEFLQRCNYNPKAFACNETHGPSRKPYVVIVLKPGLVIEDNGDPIVHECLHFLWRCSGRDRWDDGNDQHKDPLVWTAAETDLTRGMSAQSKARSLMTLHQL